MRIVFPCAASKSPTAPSFRLGDGRKVAFVADPSRAPPDRSIHHAAPDDPSGAPGLTWRDRVVQENSRAASRLSVAGQLYTPSIYRTLMASYGSENLFILSAGWGIVRADYRLPAYDITLSSVKEADRHKRRQLPDAARDFNMLTSVPDDDVVIFATKAYLPLFLALTHGHAGRRFIVHRRRDSGTVVAPAHGCTLAPFEIARRTNWHHSCAMQFMEGSFRIGDA